MSDPFIDQSTFRRILNRNIGLPLAYGFLSALFFGAIVYYIFQQNDWIESSVAQVVLLNDTNRQMVELETGLRGYLLTGEKVFLEPYERSLPRAEENLIVLRERLRKDPILFHRIELIEDLYRRWGEFARQMIVQREQNLPVAEAIRNGQGRILLEQIREQFDLIIARERLLRQEYADAARHNSAWLIGGFILFSLALSALLIWQGWRDLQLLSTSYMRSFAEQKAHAVALEKQAWYRTGQTQLSEALIGEQTLPMLGQQVLGFLAHYLGIATGALYVFEERRLQRIAEFAWDPERLERNRSLALGEGVVGQVALDRRLLTLDDVPGHYLKVSSALGEAACQSVLVMPVEDGKTLSGVLELGFLRPLRETDSELLRRVIGSIASAIESAHYRQRLQQVLSETQQLNEELQVQQEELRAANEELEVQSSALRESQTNLEEQQAELEQTNEQLSEQARALEQQRDEIQQQNERLQEARQLLVRHADDLQRASRYKSEFLANMSHELRTPLNSTLILAKLLADNAHGNLDETQVQYARSIHAAGNDLLQLINDILDLSKVEAGKLELRPESMQVSRLLEGLRGLFMPQALEKKLEFVVSAAPEVPASLFTDRLRLEQILKNLLANALKFTAQGRVELHAYVHPEGLVAFAVRDSGIGITPEQQAVIFDAFRQADGTTSRRYGGTGLGLSISRELAQRLGGRIEVVSQPEVGSTFTLLIPARYEEPAAGTVIETAIPLASAALPSPVPVDAGTTAVPAAAWLADDRQAYPFKDRCVLVIEDEPQFAVILRDLAHELRYSCLLESNADSGFEAAVRYRPDAILLDMRLPGQSGLSVLERLKDHPQTRHIPVHVVSVEGRQQAALQMGAVGYAVKPTSREDLKEVFLRLEEKLAQKVKRILLVEDDVRQRDSVVQLIDEVDVDITAVARGEEALQALRTTIFDCMIIDLKLPDMEGHALLERMTQEEICSFPPVIVYTGRNLTSEEETALMKYSRSIIIKGDRSPERLLDEVTLFLHKVESDLPPERQSMLKNAHSREKAFEGRTILVVDDDVRNVFALTSALEEKGAHVEIARNGHEALDCLRMRNDIDLVLMDVMMPEMDGFTAMQEIRKDSRLARLPIIAVTAKAMKDDQDRCLRAGANDYLAKPIDLDRLFSLIRVWLPKVELR